MVHFRREKYIAKGGPDGGNGGRGGHIILKGNRNLWTLLHLKYRKHVLASNGKGGGSALKTGASGKDVILDVPLGTIAKNAETGKVICEVLTHNQTIILTPGGRGGLGNTHFKSATNQAPLHAQPGEEGKEDWNILELKLLADVGLVGFPNAGKSTLLASVSEAKPKIANYAFTTLVPNLGIVSYHNSQSFVMADIPGIIKNAHKGKGLGHRFLRHIERNAVLLFMVSADSDDIMKEYQILLNECLTYNKELKYKQRLLAITKADLVDEELKELLLPNIPKDLPHIFISALTQEGIPELKNMIWKSLVGDEDEEF